MDCRNGTQIQEPFSFVDEQRAGPYALWYHYHELTEVEKGIRVIDSVYYEVPYRIFGKVLHFFYYKKNIETYL